MPCTQPLSTGALIRAPEGLRWALASLCPVLQGPGLRDPVGGRSAVKCGKGVGPWKAKMLPGVKCYLLQAHLRNFRLFFLFQKIVPNTKDTLGSKPLLGTWLAPPPPQGHHGNLAREVPAFHTPHSTWRLWESKMGSGSNPLERKG